MLEHGDYNVTVIDNVIVSTLKGSFNEAGTIAYTQVVKDHVAQFAGKPFAMLIDDLELEGATPESYQALNDYNVWLCQQNLIAKALVICSKTQKAITLKLSPALKQQNIEYFSCRETAMQWLKQQLASHE